MVINQKSEKLLMISSSCIRSADLHISPSFKETSTRTTIHTNIKGSAHDSYITIDSPHNYLLRMIKCRIHSCIYYAQTILEDNCSEKQYCITKNNVNI